MTVPVYSLGSPLLQEKNENADISLYSWPLYEIQFLQNSGEVTSVLVLPQSSAADYMFKSDFLLLLLLLYFLHYVPP